MFFKLELHWVEDPSYSILLDRDDSKLKFTFEIKNICIFTTAQQCIFRELQKTHGQCFQELQTHLAIE